MSALVSYREGAILHFPLNQYTLTLKHTANRWANIILPIVFFVFNVLMVWYAWNWRKQDGQPQGGNA